MTPGDASSADDSLDRLCLQARVGDQKAETHLFSVLRERFLIIAKQRVRRDDLEDVVQDALRIVHAKYQKLEAERGILVWSLTVLRNVIGNHYQSRDRRNQKEVALEDLPGFEPRVQAGKIDWLASTGTAELPEISDRLMAALAELADRFPRCRLIFQKILESLQMGGSARDVSQKAFALVQQEEPDLKREGFYTALHRCRSRLREILAGSEGRPGRD